MTRNVRHMNTLKLKNIYINGKMLPGSNTFIDR